MSGRRLNAGGAQGHDRSAELRRLASIASDSWYGSGVNAHSVHYSAAIFARHWTGRRCLELGPAEGVMTDRLVQAFDEVTVVDGAQAFLDRLVERHPRVSAVHSLFEDYTTDQTFDTIVMGHVLEHVESPAEILRRARPWLARDGRLMAAVPNAMSIHRQAAVLMGLLPTETALNETDLHHGHRRVYEPQQFRDEFTNAGYEIVAHGGYWMKPLSNAQIEATWTPQMIEAFMRVGERFPEIAAEIYVVARP